MTASFGAVIRRIKKEEGAAVSFSCGSERRILKKKKQQSSVIKYKLLYTVMILLAYLIGREIPLYGIDLSAYIDKTISIEELLMQTVGGDTYRYSLLALGISPYVVASIFSQVYVAYKRAGSKEKISPHKTTILTLTCTMLIALLQAILHARELEYAVTGGELLFVQVITVFQMIAGVMVIIWLSERNQKYGIGGRTALICVNITDGIVATMSEHSMEELKLPLIISGVLILVIIVMENAEFRVPLQRISIHNIYADKNYLAIKLNPIGTMPVMFATAFFSVPKLLVNGLSLILPGNESVIWCKENLVLTKPLGIGVYILIIYALTIGFSMIFVNPRELTEQFLKSGDCLLNIHAGRDTKQYLSKKLRRIGFFSASVMGLCLGIPLVLAYIGNLENTLVMLPASVMLLTGMWSHLFQEYQAIKSFESYEMFI